jgi:hypothetical protein
MKTKEPYEYALGYLGYEIDIDKSTFERRSTEHIRDTL